jgi:hypothetical protein
MEFPTSHKRASKPLRGTRVREETDTGLHPGYLLGYHCVFLLAATFWHAPNSLADSHATSLILPSSVRDDPDL